MQCHACFAQITWPPLLSPPLPLPFCSLEHQYSGDSDDRVKWLVYTLEQASRIADASAGESEEAVYVWGARTRRLQGQSIIQQSTAYHALRPFASRTRHTACLPTCLPTWLPACLAADGKMTWLIDFVG